MFVFKEFAMAFILENTKPFAESLIDVKKKKCIWRTTIIKIKPSTVYKDRSLGFNKKTSMEIIKKCILVFGE